MQAIVHSKYGPPEGLELKEVAKPKVGDGEVLVKIHAAALNAYDWHILRADPFIARLTTGLFKPKKTLLGADIAGRVEAVGKNVQQFKPGDEVFGEISANGGGGFAEYISVPESALVLKPVNLSFEQAAAVPMAALTALQALRDTGQIQAGQKVLINGASGGVGTFAVQLAKVFGAEVTAVCSTGKMEMVRALGADQVIDYTQEDFTQNGQRYHLILGISGYRTLSDYQRALTPQGIYVMVGGTNAQIFQALLLGSWKSRASGQKLTLVNEKPNQKDLAYLKALLEAGKIKPVLDRCYPLSVTPEAIRYLEQGHPKGKVIITMAQNHTS
jgi:NADPH:quinone reductase-like Zn-dependent oxidoreductase